jgi:SAM-dependent methyltransferase
MSPRPEPVHSLADEFGVRRRFAVVLARLLWPMRKHYRCPICAYQGPFKTKVTRRYHHIRRDAKCPCCRANERARLQFLVTAQVIAKHGRGRPDVLHIAPEEVLGRWLKRLGSRYVTADLLRRDVDCQFDIEQIPFPDRSFDLVFASHVLVYARNDAQAIREVRRVLRPGGIAVMPVPIVAEKTADPEGRRFLHEPGLDYVERFEACFDRVERYFSSQFSDEYQLYFYETALASAPPTQAEPHPVSMRVAEGKYEDMVPVCFVEGGDSL